jgi:hypothetical protein
MNEVDDGRGRATLAWVRLEEGLFKALNSQLWMRWTLGTGGVDRWGGLFGECPQEEGGGEEERQTIVSWIVRPASAVAGLAVEVLEREGLFKAKAMNEVDAGLVEGWVGERMKENEIAKERERGRFPRASHTM